VTNLLVLASAHHTLFDDLARSLGRGVMYAGAFRLMRSLPMGGAVLLVLAVLAVAWMVSRR
jgi:hypothetical protein